MFPEHVYLIMIEKDAAPPDTVQAAAGAVGRKASSAAAGDDAVDRAIANAEPGVMQAGSEPAQSDALPRGAGCADGAAIPQAEPATRVACAREDVNAFSGINSGMRANPAPAESAEGKADDTAGATLLVTETALTVDESARSAQVAPHNQGPTGDVTRTEDLSWAAQSGLASGADAGIRAEQQSETDAYTPSWSAALPDETAVPNLGGADVTAMQTSVRAEAAAYLAELAPQAAAGPTGGGSEDVPPAPAGDAGQGAEAAAGLEAARPESEGAFGTLNDAARGYAGQTEATVPPDLGAEVDVAAARTIMPAEAAAEAAGLSGSAPADVGPSYAEDMEPGAKASAELPAAQPEPASTFSTLNDAAGWTAGAMSEALAEVGGHLPDDSAAPAAAEHEGLPVQEPEAVTAAEAPRAVSPEPPHDAPKPAERPELRLWPEQILAKGTLNPEPADERLEAAARQILGELMQEQERRAEDKAGAGKMATIISADHCTYDSHPAQTAPPVTEQRQDMHTAAAIGEQQKSARQTAPVPAAAGPGTANRAPAPGQQSGTVRQQPASAPSAAPRQNAAPPAGVQTPQPAAADGMGHLAHVEMPEKEPFDKWRTGQRGQGTEHIMGQQQKPGHMQGQTGMRRQGHEAPPQTMQHSGGAPQQPTPSRRQGRGLSPAQQPGATLPQHTRRQINVQEGQAAAASAQGPAARTGMRQTGRPRADLRKPDLPPATSPKPAPPPTPLSDDEVLARTAAQWSFNAVPPGTPDSYGDERMRQHEDFQGSTVDGAHVRGKKHKHQGTNSDDWFETGAVEDITLLAVSDGAGSRKLSRVGSRTACKAAIAYLTKELTDMLSEDMTREMMRKRIVMPPDNGMFVQLGNDLSEMMRGAVLHAIDEVEKACEERVDDPVYQEILGGRRPEPADFAATLLLAMIVPIEGRKKLILTCQVGDGMIITIDKQAPFRDGDKVTAVRLLGEADSGEFSGETEFITSPSVRTEDALMRRTRAFCGNSDIVMAMTDGVADDYFPNDTQMPRLYYDMLANGILEERAPVGGKGGSDVLVPNPVEFPWVDNKQVKVSLQYANRLMEASRKTVEELWDARARIFSKARETLPKPIGATTSDKLFTWLDNYVQRGSFDDRTLVIAQLKEATR